jgi:hypothetical protein
MDEKYKYDYYFLATEDNNIREKFKKEFKDKVKFLLPEKIFEYDYEDANYLTYYQEVFGNLECHQPLQSLYPEEGRPHHHLSTKD